ncbi:hypothetical protein C8R43DRAFT_959122 [Mycena crocata]|nr:hypothetical protein C8R43DRAFT_959122 [Mycena crocata]
MRRPRLLRSSTSNAWIARLIVVSKGIVAVGNCLPFPYVKTALESGLALLELIETVSKSSDDLRYLAESVVTIMKLLREEMESHPNGGDDTKFCRVCAEFVTHLTQLSRDLASMAKNWSSSRFRRYLNSHNIQEEITRFTREVNDLRANATLIAATGTRLDLIGVGNGVAAVESKISDLQRELACERSNTTTSLKQELTRFEEDVSRNSQPYGGFSSNRFKFHSVKLGDIELDFRTARTATFEGIDFVGNRTTRTCWTDYEATVKGSIRTVRVYQGSTPEEKIHQFWTLDSYARSLPSAQAIVDWERDINGRLIISHIDDYDAHRILKGLPPFLGWFVYAPLWKTEHESPHLLTNSEGRMHDIFSTLSRLGRQDGHYLKIPKALVGRGCVYSRETPVAQLADRNITTDDSWRVTYIVACAHNTRYPPNPWPPNECFSRLGSIERSGWTQSGCFISVDINLLISAIHSFIVPFLGKDRQWLSLHDHRPHSGYFLTTSIEFGKNIPDIT